MKKIWFLLLALASLSFLAACGGIPPGGWSGVTVADSAVYFGGSNQKLYALDLGKQALKWAPFAGDKDRPLGYVYGQPAVQDGTVYFGAMDGVLYALDANTGTEKWKPFDATAGAADKRGIIPSPVVDAGVVYFGANDHNLYAVNAADGSLKWKFATTEKIWGDVTVDNGTLYFGSLDHHLYALDLNGNKKWAFDAGGIVVTKPLVSNGVAYFGALEKLFALDVSGTEPRVVWTKSLDVDHWIWSSPALKDGVLYVGDLGGQLHALDAKTGDVKWTFEVPHQEPSRAIRSGIAVSEALVYFGVGNNNDANARAGKVYALDVSNGQLKWSFPTLGGVYGAPAVQGDTVYVVSRLHGFYSLNAADGTLKWAFDTSKDVSGTPAP